MGIINKILENNFLFYSLIFILLISFLVVLYFAFFRKKNENNRKVELVETKKQDIDDILEEVIEGNEKQEEKIDENELQDNEIQKVLNQMSEDIKKEDNTVEKFELDQEENAVISYQELVNNVRSEKIIVNLEDIYEDEALEEIKKEEVIYENIEEDKNEDIETLNIEDELIDLLNSKSDVKIESVKEEPKEERKYRRSEIISPIFGKQEVDLSYPKIETFKRSKIEEENNEEFLNNLREFRKNL